MHDFCFTIPIGVILLAGAVIDFWSRRSLASFSEVSLTGIIFLLSGHLSYSLFKKKRKSLILTAMCLVAGAGITFLMAQRYMLTQMILPYGSIAGISAFMTGFWVYKLVRGDHISAKEE